MGLATGVSRTGTGQSAICGSICGRLKGRGAVQSRASPGWKEGGGRCETWKQQRAKNVHLQVTSKWGLQVPSKIKDPKALLLPRGRTPTALENPAMAEQPHSHRETWLPTCFRGGWSENGTWVPGETGSRCGQYLLGFCIQIPVPEEIIGHSLILIPSILPSSRKD